MKKQLVLFAMLSLFAMTAAAKKVKVTIHGNNIDWYTDIRVIVNEKIDEYHHASVENGHFSITLKVEKGAFIRLAPYKTEPMANGARRVIKDFSKNSHQGTVIVAEGGKVSIDMRTNEIKGSPLSKKLKERRNILEEIDRQIFQLREYPRGLHLTREQLKAREREIEKLEEAQKQLLNRFVEEDSATPLPAWYACNYPLEAIQPAYQQAQQRKAAWLSHPILKPVD